MSTQREETAFTQLSRNDKLYRIRHSFAHLMAMAVTELFDGVRCTIGPPIEQGFYYDFDMPHVLTEKDLEKIETRMRSFLKNDRVPFEQKYHSRKQARDLFSTNPYKIELIDGIDQDEKIGTYTVGDFVDLCRGPHVPDTSYLHPHAFKLMSLAGAYWRGDETRQMLQRIYATAWDNPKALRTHLAFLAEAEKRDHRRLGKELDLFSVHDEAGSGLIYWHPKGSRIRTAIEDYWRKKHEHNGYDVLYTPHIGKEWLWETSGHLDFYKESMYSPMELDTHHYYAKPMNCPFHILIYKTRQRSYKNLPLRWAELGTVYRYERSGVLHGLLRVRGFTQDDAHIFCTPDQTESEITEVIRFSLEVWKDFGFDDITAYLATRPKKAVGSKEDWDNATSALLHAAEREKLDVQIDEGGGAFYGPKIDLKIKDALNREWQMSTIQFDFNMPERFDIHFVDADGRKHRPYMVHRALLGSLERFFGVLIEHYNGAFPVWLAPIQAEILPVSDHYVPQAEKYCTMIRTAGIRARVREEERLSARIRKAQLQKIPYMFVVGEKEAADGTASCRLRTGEQLGKMTSSQCVRFIEEKINAKAPI